MTRPHSENCNRKMNVVSPLRPVALRAGAKSLIRKIRLGKKARKRIRKAKNIMVSVCPSTEADRVYDVINDVTGVLRRVIGKRAEAACVIKQ